LVALHIISGLVFYGCSTRMLSLLHCCIKQPINFGKWRNQPNGVWLSFSPLQCPLLQQQHYSCLQLAPLHRPALLRMVINHMSCDTLRPRSHYRIPSHEDSGQNLPTGLNHRVYLCHPGYSETSNILMGLPALDHPQGGSTTKLHELRALLLLTIMGRILNGNKDG
jgi:hypothetical protein